MASNAPAATVAAPGLTAGRVTPPAAATTPIGDEVETTESGGRAAEDPPPRMIDGRAVALRLGVSPSSLRRMVLDRRFPPGVRMGGRAVRWSTEAVTAWIRRAQSEATLPPETR